ncbi:MAG TPA: hypothetical protein VFL96_06685 [Acidobacteriaceae bacterium]|nr:hypothetical protein [Acidobacteriaceae bacterium]
MATGFRLSAPRDYRRGVVLGLTLAEVLVLLTFLLLLAMSALLLRNERQQAELRRQVEQDARIVAVVGRVAAKQGLPVDDDRLANLIRDGEQAESLRSQLQEARQRADIAAQAVADNAAMVALLQRVPGSSSKSPVEKLSELVQNHQALMERDKILTKKDENLVGQNNQMRIELARVKGNGGSGLPYCWATPDGKPEYMLKVDMYDNGVIVQDLEPRARPDDAVWRTLDEIARDQLIPLENFMSQVQPLKAGEAAGRCQYAIEVFDSTARTNKPGYKLTMRRLWSMFHLHEIH